VLKKKVSADFHSRNIYSASVDATAFQNALKKKEEKYSLTVGFEPVTIFI